MKKIEWTDEYSVGVEKLDNQHKNIINFINKLISNPEIDVHSETLHDILQEMMRYSKEHLYDEEMLLRQNGYSDFDTHVNYHMEYLEKFAELSLSVTESDLTVPADLLSFLRNWWANHILVEDMKYKSFFNDKGIY